MKSKLIYLEWEDAVTNNVGWVPAEEAKAWAREKFGLIRECGWVLDENPEFILLSNRMSALSGGGFEDPDVGGIHKIPKTWIRKRRVLDPFQRKSGMVHMPTAVSVKKRKMENVDDYQVQSQANEAIFWNLIQKTMPDFYVLMREIKDSEVNPFVLTKIARALALIANGTKYGKVMTIVENGTATFIYGEEANKINEPVIKKIQLP